MKVLVSAYACEPGRGSEPEAGWRWVSAATRAHEVWVLTHGTNEDAVRSALATDPALATRMHPVFLRAPRWARPLRRRGPTRFLYYLVWQLTACRSTARALHDVVGFDVVHHVTYASDWAPSGLTGLGVPFVWGPVGGSSTPTRPALWRLLGLRTTVSEIVRAALLGLLRRTSGAATATRATVVVGQNEDVVDAFPRAHVLVEPNVALDDPTPGRAVSDDATGPVAVFAGRLLGWKGLTLALAAIARPTASAWRLDVYGDGPERTRLEARARSLGVSDRVRFLGRRPRAEVLTALAAADAFLLPSLHDSAGWAVAEAQAAGCPVVALAAGGPRTLVDVSAGVLVDPGADDVVGDLADALGTVRGRRPDRERWGADRLPGVVDTLYAEAATGRGVVR